MYMIKAYLPILYRGVEQLTSVLFRMYELMKPLTFYHYKNKKYEFFSFVYTPYKVKNGKKFPSRRFLWAIHPITAIFYA